MSLFLDQDGSSSCRLLGSGLVKYMCVKLHQEMTNASQLFWSRTGAVLVICLASGQE